MQESSTVEDQLWKVVLKQEQKLKKEVSERIERQNDIKALVQQKASDLEKTLLSDFEKATSALETQLSAL